MREDLTPPASPPTLSASEPEAAERSAAAEPPALESPPDPLSILVCATCRDSADPAARPGAALLAGLAAQIAQDPARYAHVTLAAVECLSVCKRPATLAFLSPGRWSYVIGDLDPVLGVPDVLCMARAYPRAPEGIVAWRERPTSFRKGVIARIPALPSAPVQL